MTIDTKQMDAVGHRGRRPARAVAGLPSEPVPEPGPGEVLVEVHAAAVNPLDVVNAAGWLGTPLPVIPGGDYAGIVVSDGDHAGQQVWGSGPALGMAMGTKRQGTHARFVALPETWLSRKPEQLTLAEAAAVGRSYFVAWQTVINIMQLMPGETILITGGAGMVGQAAAAIARWRGAEPIIAGRAQARRRRALHRHHLNRHARGGARTHRRAGRRPGPGHRRRGPVPARSAQPAVRRPADRDLQRPRPQARLLRGRDLQPAAARHGAGQRIHGRGRRRPHLRPAPPAVRPRLPFPPARARPGRSRTAPGPTRQYWTDRPASSRFCCQPCYRLPTALARASHSSDSLAGQRR